MRILPLVFLLQPESDIALRFDRTKEMSGITHAHLRSELACFIYLGLARGLIEGLPKQVAYTHMQQEVSAFLRRDEINPDEVKVFERVLEADIAELNVTDISSSGYVVDTLKSSLWCFLRSSSHSESVLRGVNLGDDTDTTGCVVGGLAGLYYGFEALPAHWVENLVRSQAIQALANALTSQCGHEKKS